MKLFVLALVCASASVRADEAVERAIAENEHCEAIDGGSEKLEQQSSRDRLFWIQRHMDHEAWKARIYTWTFISAYGGLAVFNGIRLGVDHRTYGNKADNGVAVGGSLFGVAVMSIMPPAILRDQHKLSKIVSGFRDDHACATLAQVEKLLVKDAKAEAFSRSVLIHMGNLGFNFALGIFVGAALHRWDTGFIVGPTAALGGELQILSLPTDINATLSQYRSGDLRERLSTRNVSWAVSPQFGRDQVGLMGGISF